MTAPETQWPRDLVVRAVLVMDMARQEVLYTSAHSVASSAWSCAEYEPAYRLGPDENAVVELLIECAAFVLVPGHLRFDETHEPVEVDLVEVTPAGRELYDRLDARLRQGAAS